ncbi:MAG TPA: STAS domain-containing protein [Terriglobales bacterium]
MRTRKGQVNMSSSAVVVKLPEAMNAKNARRLGRELKAKLGGSSPFVVLDLSHMKSIDVSGVEGLLRCMSEVAKQDGALQLSGLSPEAATLLELTRLDKLMQKFPGFSIETPAFEMAPESITEEVEADAVQLPVVA